MRHSGKSCLSNTESCLYLHESFRVVSLLLFFLACLFTVCFPFFFGLFVFFLGGGCDDRVPISRHSRRYIVSIL